MTKVCRLCLSRLQRGSKYFNINAVESFTGFMPYRDQLTTCIPEMALDLIPNPVICNNCRNALKSSYDFKSRCLLVEKKIRQYVESQPPETTIYNLTEIDTSSLPRPTKCEPEISKEPPKLSPLLPKVEVQKIYSHPTSILSNLLSVREEVILPNPSEIEITNVKYVPAIQKVKASTKMPKRVSQITYTPIEKDEHGLFTCNHCDKKFPNVPSLHTHKTRVHEEDYLCNFCNVPFKTLQNLRKHNQQCQKVRSSPATPSQSVLAKRPHLPTKAKNHLKRWLFNHTDHPYPTDVEKQQLMKETNLSLLQVENWFINARRRILADLTRLKNMRGGLFRGRRLGRGRGRGQIDIAVLDEDMFDEDPEGMLEEEEHDEAMAASRLLKDLEENESEPSFQDAEVEKITEQCIETPGVSNEETLDRGSESDIKQVIENTLESERGNSPDQDAESTENTDEQDPLEDRPPSSLSSTVKMEIDIEERLYFSIRPRRQKYTFVS